MNQPGAAITRQQEPDPNKPQEPDAKPTPDAGAVDDDAFTEVEQVAMEMGWNPDHEGDRDFVDARTYIMRSGQIQKTMQRTIEGMKKDQEQFKEAMVNLRDHYKQLDKAEAGKIDSQIDSLQKQFNDAVEDGDVPRSTELMNQMNELREQKKQAESAAEPAAQPAQPQQPDLTPAQETFLRENPWYGTDNEMTEYANAQSQQFAGLPEDRYFVELLKRVKQMFPDRFPAPRRSAVEPGGRRAQAGGGKRKHSINDLSDDQKRMAMFYEKQGVMKVDEYIAELERIGTLQ